MFGKEKKKKFRLILCFAEVRYNKGVSYVPPFTLHLISNVSGDVCWKKSQRYVNINRLTLHNQNVKLKQALINKKKQFFAECELNCVTLRCQHLKVKERKKYPCFLYFAMSSHLLYAFSNIWKTENIKHRKLTKLTGHPQRWWSRYKAFF